MHDLMLHIKKASMRLLFMVESCRTGHGMGAYSKTQKEKHDFTISPI